MSETNLKEQINLLVNLQVLDTQIYSLQQEKENLPIKLKQIEAAFAQKKENLAKLEEKKQLLQRQRKDKELELGSKEEEQKKLKAQLYQLKTNKEYDAKLKEIDGAGADASVLEDGILELFEQTDKTSSQIGKEKEFLIEEEKRANVEKQQINSRGEEFDGKLIQLDAQKKRIAEQVSPRILSTYNKILSSCGHLAIVKVENDACQGCFMNVMPQSINRVLMYDKLVTCEACQRILYLEE